jgi:predicted RNA-binding Zn ribbon-like protein
VNLALSLANTPGDPTALETWRRDAGAPADVDPRTLVHLRSTVRGSLEAIADGAEVPQASVSLLNRTSEAGPTYARLEASEVCYVTLASPGEAFLAEVAADAIELVGGPRRPLLRRCDAPGCGNIFVASRPRQTWCSDRCGVRARVARHRAA